MNVLISPEIHGESELGLRYDLQTQFAELVDGNMRTNFELRFNGYDLIGQDGRGMNKITADALNEAEEMAKLYPDLWFEKRRRGLEREEFHELLEMAQGKGPNTMVVVSDFPAELVDATEDVGGYNVTRQQTMLRVLICKPDGNVQMYSQSLDGSNRQGLEAVYSRFGIEPEVGELLGHRIRVDLKPEQQNTLSDELTGVYDRNLTAQFGGQWYAGRRPADYRNTYDFVCQQNDLIEECVRLDNLGWLNDSIMYKMSARMQERFETDQQGEINVLLPQVAIDIAVLHREIEMAGARASQRGLSFSACGATLRANGLNNSLDSLLKLAGYGNKSLDGDCEFISKKCPECNAENVKTRVTKISETQKHISGSCGCSKIVSD